MDHVGWTLQYTALYYMQLAKVLNLTGASARLASIIGSEATSTWQDINQLKRFIYASPMDSPAKRPLRGTQREYSSKPLKHSIVKRILVFKQ